MRTRALLPVLVTGVLLSSTVMTASASPSHGSLPGHRAVTRAAVTALLRHAPVLPGAHEAHGLPVLRRPNSSVAGAGHLERATRWWTAPGGLSAAARWLRSHPGPGLHLVGWGSAGGPNGVTERDVYLLPRRTSTRAFTALGLTLSVVRYRGGVAVRADATALWLAYRSAAERVPLSITGAVVTVIRRDRMGRPLPDVRATLSARQARRLARLLNGLTVFPPGIFSCPMDDGSGDRVRFLGAGRTLVFLAAATGCEPVTVRSNGAEQPALSGGGRVADLVRRLIN